MNFSSASEYNPEAAGSRAAIVLLEGKRQTRGAIAESTEADSLTVL
jgi:hypothetical protein